MKTKALRIWKTAYEEARHIMSLDDAMKRAAKKLASEMGVKLRCDEDSNGVCVVAIMPGGSLFGSETQVGYRTTTIELRLTEQVLGMVKVKDLWR